MQSEQDSKPCVISAAALSYKFTSHGLFSTCHPLHFKLLGLRHMTFQKWFESNESSVNFAMIDHFALPYCGCFDIRTSEVILRFPYAWLERFFSLLWHGGASLQHPLGIVARPPLVLHLCAGSRMAFTTGSYLEIAEEFPVQSEAISPNIAVPWEDRRRRYVFFASWLLRYCTVKPNFLHCYNQVSTTPRSHTSLSATCREF